MRGRDYMATRMAREFERLVRSLEQLNADMELECKKALQVESHKVIRDAKRLTPVNTGLLRNSWYSNRIERQGDSWEKEVGNSSEYASFIENGFRSHFVPGEWIGNSFNYNANSDKGMFVGGKKNRFVRGKHMLEKATQKTERRIYQYLSRRIERLRREFND